MDLLRTHLKPTVGAESIQFWFIVQPEEKDLRAAGAHRLGAEATDMETD